MKGTSQGKYDTCKGDFNALSVGDYHSFGDDQFRQKINLDLGINTS